MSKKKHKKNKINKKELKKLKKKYKKEKKKRKELEIFLTNKEQKNSENDSSGFFKTFLTHIKALILLSLTDKVMELSNHIQSKCEYKEDLFYDNLFDEIIEDKFNSSEEDINLEELCKEIDDFCNEDDFLD